MADTYPWHYKFRLRIAALTLDPLWTGRVGKIILPEYFEDVAEQEAVAAIYHYREQYGKTPSSADDVTIFCNNKRAMEIVYDIFDVKREAIEFDMPQSVAVQWAKEQSIKIAILDSIPDIKSGKLSDVVKRVNEAITVGENIQSPGIDFIQDTHIWLYDLWINKVQTGWLYVDRHLEGGLGSGELGIILAPTNRGKSVALVNIAYGAAGIGSGKNVVILTHEMSPAKYARRLASRMLFRFPARDENLYEYEKELLELASRMMPGTVKIVGGAKTMSVYDVRDAIQRLEDEGFKPDIIIDDYADLLQPPKSYGERRHELTSIYMWLRAYAGELGVPIWTASQVGRQAYTSDVIRIQDIAEDIGKANTADVIIAICQTPDEELRERCRLFLPKVRDYKHGVMYNAKYYTKSQAIITIGETLTNKMENI